METKTKMTQRDIVLWHLQNVGTLTRAQAMYEYGIVELPARIVELKRLGHRITSEKGHSENRFGKITFNPTIQELIKEAMYLLILSHMKGTQAQKSPKASLSITSTASKRITSLKI